jgi:hypothetical protein
MVRSDLAGRACLYCALVNTVAYSKNHTSLTSSDKLRFQSGHCADHLRAVSVKGKSQSPTRNDRLEGGDGCIEGL